MAATIWVFVETDNGRPHRLALEMLSGARELGTVEAVLLTPEPGAILPILGEYGASKVYLHRHHAYEEYLVLPAVDTLTALVEQRRPDLLLFGTTYYSRDVAARLAGRLKSGAITDATGLAVKDGSVEATIPALGGTYAVTSTLVNAGTKIVLVRPKAFEAVPVGGGATVEELDIPIRPEACRMRVLGKSVTAQEETGPALEDAQFVVSGGRGMKGADRFQMLHELAELFGGAVGASRGAVDLGFAPYSCQVGQTGKTVKPQVYLACGISGAFQHVIGMSGSKSIVAINKDPEADIFKIADFGVVGDVFKVVPQLIEEVRRRKGGS